MSAEAVVEHRLDVFLSRTRLIMPRGSAKRACDNGIVAVNGRPAKPATLIHPGDRIDIRFTDQDLSVSVDRMPGRSVRKSDAATHYTVLVDHRHS